MRRKAIILAWALLALAIILPAVQESEPLKAENAPAADFSGDPRFVQALNLLDVWVEAKLAYDKIFGVSMGLVVDQDLVWSKGFGWADVERNVPTTPQTIYSICSISKLFTAIAVMQLRDQGKLRLDDPVTALLPWFDIEQTFPDAPQPTVRDLLTHSSGLPRESDHPYWTGPDFPFPTRDEVIEGLSNQGMLYPAERYFQYSNLGLTLAGQIVEQVSGEPFELYVRRHILEPLELAQTAPSLPEAERGKLMAIGYGVLSREGKRPVMPFFQAKGIAPAAGFSSTVVDLARFASWQFRLLETGATEILDADTLREMQRVQWMDEDWGSTRGLGFGVWRGDGKTYVGHGGSCPGFRTQLTLIPRDKLAGVAMVNAMGVSPEEFIDQMFKILGAAVETIKKAPGEGRAPDPALAKYSGLYRSAWGEEAIIVWDNGLAVVGLPSDNPLGWMEKLKPIEGHTFRRIRDDGELGEEVVFEIGPEGEVLRYWQHGNSTEKIR